MYLSLKYKYKYCRFPRNILEYIPSTLQIVLKNLNTDVLKYKVLLPGSATRCYEM